jgi:hypothetical protein
MLNKILLEIKKETPSNNNIIKLTRLMINNVKLLSNILIKIKNIIFENFSINNINDY